MTDYHSPAYFVAARWVYALRRFHPLPALDITDPVAQFVAARMQVENALFAFATEANGEARRAVDQELIALMVADFSRRQAAALNAEWNEAASPLFASPSLKQLARFARVFVNAHQHEIQRIARALLSERRVSEATARWMLDPEPVRLAA